MKSPDRFPESGKELKLRLSFVSDREGTNGWAVHDLVHGNAQGIGYGRVKVRDGHGTFDDLFGPLGSLAVDITAFEPTPSQNAGKSLRVVVSANVLVNEWSTAEFGRQDNDGVVEFSNGFQVLEQSRDSLIHGMAEFGERREIVRMSVPPPETYFHRPDVSFDQTAGKEASLPEGFGAVAFFSFWGLLCEC